MRTFLRFAFILTVSFVAASGVDGGRGSPPQGPPPPPVRWDNPRLFNNPDFRALKLRVETGQATKLERQYYRRILSRVSPLEAIPGGAYEYARWQQDQFTAKSQLNSGSAPTAEAATAWTEIGPRNVEGRVTAVAPHPTNTNIVFAAGEAGGIFGSTDGGSTWTTSTDQLPDLRIEDIQYVPGNPSTMFAGAGGGHLYRSTDSGVTWTIRAVLPDRVGWAMPDRTVDRIRINPQNTSIMYAVQQVFWGGLGVYKSANSGQTWTRILPSTTTNAAGANDLAIDPGNPSRLWAAINGDGIYRTTNSGNSWTKLNGPGQNNGLPAAIDEAVLGVARSDPRIVYAALREPSGAEGFYVSTNRGTSWTLQCGSANLNCVVDPWEPKIFGCCLGIGGNDGEILVDPNNPDLVYFSNFERQYKSTNRGLTLVHIPQHHVDGQSFAIQPSNSQWLWAGNDGGLEKSTNQAATGTAADWTEINRLPVTQFYDMAVMPGDPNLATGGTQDNDINIYRGTLDWLRRGGCLFGDQAAQAIDSMSKILYSNSNATCVSETTDLGDTWRGVNSGLDNTNSVWESPLAVSDAGTGILYTGGDKVHKSRVNSTPGLYQHYFGGANPGLLIPAGSTIVQWIYIPAGTPPREIMLQFFSDTGGGWEHRAFWGEDLINFGTRVRIGDIPSGRDQWIQLNVSAETVGLAGHTISGWAYTLYDGALWWDHSAVQSGAGETVFVEDAPPPGATASGDYPDSWTWDTNRIFTGARTHRSTPGLAWTAISGALAPGGLTAIAASPFSSDFIYAGYSSGRLFKTTNNGAGWTEITDVLGRWGGRFISAVAVDAANENTVYLTLNGFGVSHIWKTTDGGGTWIDLWTGKGLPDAPFSDVAVSPVNGNRVVVTNDIGGAFESLDGGLTWAPAGDLATLPNNSISGVALERGVDLTVSTYGRSMWRLPGSRDLAPDFIPEVVRVLPSSPRAGDFTTFNSDLWNRGDLDFAAGTVRFCLDNPSCTTSQNGLISEYQSLSNIPPNSYIGVWSVAWTATAGYHQIYFCADVYKQVPELNEANNCRAVAFTVTP